MKQELFGQDPDVKKLMLWKSPPKPYEEAVMKDIEHLWDKMLHHKKRIDQYKAFLKGSSPRRHLEERNSLQYHKERYEVISRELKEKDSDLINACKRRVK